MLYCPKCQQTYPKGERRFCADDNARLLPAPSSGNSVNRTDGVFTNVFSRAAQRKNVETAAAEELSANFAGNSETFQNGGFRPPSISKIFKSESDSQENPPSPPAPKIFKSFENFSVELPDAPIPKPEMSAQKPLPRVVRPDEIPASQATLGDRKINPRGRLALTWENPQALVGQTVKGRYLIVEKTGEDETGITFLAEDKIVENKKVAVRVVMDEETDDYFTDKIYADERVSFSHLNHPNVAGVIDSGELPEAKPFVITEYVVGDSITAALRQTGQFNAARAARIVRQAAYALSAVHQVGVLHRNLTAENIVLSVSENGTELVKLTGFGVSQRKSDAENAAYQSPEQLEGKIGTTAGDVYSLAVVAFQILTNRLPFGAQKTGSGSLLKARRAGLSLLPTNLRLDVTAAVDEVLEKALAFNPSERYPKARDFGDAFFNAITAATDALWENDAAITDGAEKLDENADANRQTKPSLEIETATAASDLAAGVATANLTDSNSAAAIVSPAEFAGVERRAETSAAAANKTTANPLWERRSTDKPQTAGKNWALIFLLGAFIVLSAAGLGYFLMNRPNESAFIQQTSPSSEQPVEAVAPPSQPVVEIESPPPPRGIQPPPNSVYFENSKQELKSEAAKNFLGFSLYYPNDWRRNDAKDNFLDVSKNASTGTPVEQMLISYYDSKGTFNKDQALFPTLVKQTNSTLKEIVPNYRQTSEGEKTVNNGWRAYEVKFEGAGKTSKGEDIKLWGRRLFIPAARNGLKNGYVLTLLATSLSPEVKSVEDVGVKGDLATILNSFEPNQNF